MEISEDMVFKTTGVIWRNNRVNPSVGQGEDIVYLTKNRRAGVLKSASLNRNWRWLIDKYSIVWWTYLSDLIFF